MSRWTDVAAHPDGFVVATCTEVKDPWLLVRVAHQEWAQRRKKDRYVWLVWNRASRQLYPASKSPTTLGFSSDLPEIKVWATQFLREPLIGPTGGWISGWAFHNARRWWVSIPLGGLGN
jgi:hypothetical protein